MKLKLRHDFGPSVSQSFQHQTAHTIEKIYSLDMYLQCCNIENLKVAHVEAGQGCVIDWGCVIDTSITVPVAKTIIPLSRVAKQRPGRLLR